VLSQLYRDFAEPENMYEVQLMIFHVSDHRDPELVRNAWQALLDEGEWHYRARQNAELTPSFSAQLQRGRARAGVRARRLRRRRARKAVPHF